MTPTIVAAIKEYQASAPEPEEQTKPETNPPPRPDEPTLTDPQPNNPISHTQLIRIARHLRAAPSGYTLASLLRGTTVHHPPPRPKDAQTPEYHALMARLRRDAESAAYARMLRSPAAPTTKRKAEVEVEKDDDNETTYADVSRQLTLVLNILISIVACAVALWMASGHWSAPRRLALSMCGSAGVGVAEVVVYAGYIRRVGEAKGRERGRREVRSVVERWEVGRKGNEKKE